MNPRKHRKIWLSLLALTVSASVMASQTQRANALFPQILSITPWISGTHTILNITVYHQAAPALGPSHYVSNISLDINGTLHNLPQSTPQTTETFVVQYDMGEVTTPVSVRAQAYCTVHLWGPLSDTVVVPEYSFPYVLLILMLGAIVIVAAKFAVTVSRKRPASPSNNPVREQASA